MRLLLLTHALALGYSLPECWTEVPHTQSVIAMKKNMWLDCAAYPDDGHPGCQDGYDNPVTVSQGGWTFLNDSENTGNLYMCGGIATGSGSDGVSLSAYYRCSSSVRPEDATIAIDTANECGRYTLYGQDNYNCVFDCTQCEASSVTVAPSTPDVEQTTISPTACTPSVAHTQSISVRGGVDAHGYQGCTYPYPVTIQQGGMSYLNDTENTGKQFMCKGYAEGGWGIAQSKDYRCRGDATFTPTQASVAVGTQDENGKYWMYCASSSYHAVFDCTECDGDATTTSAPTTPHVPTSTPAALSCSMQQVGYALYHENLDDSNYLERVVLSPSNPSFLFGSICVGSAFIVVDVSSPSEPKIVSTISDERLQCATHVAVAPSGDFIFVVGLDYWLSSSSSIAAVNISSPTDPHIVSVTSSSPAWSIAVSEDGRYMYAAIRFTNTLAVYDVTDPAGQGMILVGEYTDDTHLDGVSSVVVCPDGTHVIVACVSGSVVALDVSDPTDITLVSGGLKIQDTVVSTWSGTSVALTADGNTLFLLLSGKLLWVDVSTRMDLTVLLSVEDDITSSALSLKLSPDDNFLYVGSGGTDVVSLVDVRSASRMEIRAQVWSESGDLKTPIGIDGSEDGRYLYVASKGSSGVVVAEVDCAQHNQPFSNSTTLKRATTNRATTNQPTTHQPTTSQLTTKQPTAKQPTTIHPTTGRPTTNQPTTNQPTANQPTANRSTANQPTASQPAANQPTANQPTANQATANQATANQATANQATANQATANQATVHRPTTNQATTNRSATTPVTNDATSYGPMPTSNPLSTATTSRRRAKRTAGTTQATDGQRYDKVTALKGTPDSSADVTGASNDESLLFVDNAASTTTLSGSSVLCLVACMLLLVK